MFDYPPFIIYFFCGFLAFATFIFTASALFVGFKKVVTIECCNKVNPCEAKDQEEDIDIPDNEKIF